MKHFFLVFLIILFPIYSFAQIDSLELEIQKKQLELMKQELEIQKQELEMKIEDNKTYKEDRQERKAREREERDLKKNDQQRINALMESNTNIFLNPLPLFVGGFEGGVEKRIDKKKSLRMVAGYYYSESPWYYLDATEMQGAKINIQYRAYLQDFRPGMFGLYVGPDLTFKTIGYKQTISTYETTNTYPYYTYSTRDTTHQAMAGAVGFVCGYQTLLFQRMTFDFHFGANLVLPISEYKNSDVSLPLVNPYGKGSHAKFSISIGVPF